MTEWCQRDEDSSPGLIDSAMSYGEMMHEAFRGSANEGGRIQRLQSVPAIRRRTQKSGARAKGAQE